jgi:HK97 gp10 family phage protein
MALSVKLQVTGDRELKRKLASLSQAARGKTLERALVAGALIVQNDAKIRAPWITGNLRRSIHIGGHDDLNPDNGQPIIERSGADVPAPQIGPNTVAVYVGTDVNYAAAAEFGIGNRRAHPYLRPAMDQNQDAVSRECGEALQDLIHAAVR